MMRESLKARQDLIRDGSPLVKTIGYLHTIYKNDKIMSDSRGQLVTPQVA